MRAGTAVVFDHLPDLVRGSGVPAGVGEVAAVVGQHDVDLVGDGFDQSVQEACRDTRRRFRVSISEDKLAGPIDGDKQIEPAFGRLNSAMSI